MSLAIIIRDPYPYLDLFANRAWCGGCGRRDAAVHASRGHGCRQRLESSAEGLDGRVVFRDGRLAGDIKGKVSAHRPRSEWSSVAGFAPVAAEGSVHVSEPQKCLWDRVLGATLCEGVVYYLSESLWPAIYGRVYLSGHTASANRGTLVW